MTRRWQCSARSTSQHAGEPKADKHRGEPSGESGWSVQAFSVHGRRGTHHRLMFTLSLIGPDRRGSHDIHWVDPRRGGVSHCRCIAATVHVEGEWERFVV